MLLGEDFNVSEQAGKIAAACLALALGLLILKKLFFRGGKKPHKDLQKGQREILDEYPDPPPAKEGRRLQFDGLDVRLRFVAVAPTGKQHEPIDVDVIPEILDDLLRGFGAFVKSDRPRIKVWPPQLSAAGFPPTFFRLVESPDVVGQKSQWVRVAGTIKIGGRPFLLGLALYSEEPSKVGAVTLEPTDWTKHFQIER
jgi:hypothetical protein